MRILKLLIRAGAVSSLSAWVLTAKDLAAIPLMIFSSMSLGILIGEKIDGGKNYERRNEK